MENNLVSLDISKLNFLELVGKATKVANGMEANAADLLNVQPTSADIRTEAQFLATLIQRETDLLTELAGTRQQIRMKGKKINSMLKNAAHQIEILANNTHDPSLIERTGFDLRTSRKTKISELGTPLNVRLTEVPHTSGALNISFKAVTHARNYGVIWAYGTASPQTWQEMPMKIIALARGTKLKFEAGQTVWVRVKAYGPNNTESDWSDIAMRIVP